MFTAHCGLPLLSKVGSGSSAPCSRKQFANWSQSLCFSLGLSWADPGLGLALGAEPTCATGGAADVDPAPQAVESDSTAAMKIETGKMSVMAHNPRLALLRRGLAAH